MYLFIEATKLIGSVQLFLAKSGTEEIHRAWSTKRGEHCLFWCSRRESRTTIETGEHTRERCRHDVSHRPMGTRYDCYPNAVKSNRREVPLELLCSPIHCPDAAQACLLASTSGDEEVQNDRDDQTERDCEGDQQYWPTQWTLCRLEHNQLQAATHPY